MENKQLKKIKDKCQLFNQFLIDRAGMPAHLFEETNRLLEKAYHEKDLKVLKAADRDNYEQIRHMPPSLALEFKKRLKEILNIDFDIIDKIYSKNISKILKKGKIANAEEYNLILNYIDEIYVDSNKSDEVNRLNEFLKAYLVRSDNSRLAI